MIAAAPPLAAALCRELNRRGLTVEHVKRAATAIRALPANPPDDQWTYEERVAIAVLDAALRP